MAHGPATISFLAGDTGLLPEIAATPPERQSERPISTAFNSGIQGVLAGYAAQGSIVHYLDLTQCLPDQREPGGLRDHQGLVCPIFPNTTCVVDSSGYLFYVTPSPDLHGLRHPWQYVAVAACGPADAAGALRSRPGPWTAVGADPFEPRRPLRP